MDRIDRYLNWRMIDAIGGLALLGTALLMRRRSLTTRSILAAAGSACLATAFLIRSRKAGPMLIREKSPIELYAEERRPIGARPRGPQEPSAGYAGRLTEAAWI
jgi:hypothetical protein